MALVLIPICLFILVQTIRSVIEPRLQSKFLTLFVGSFVMRLVLFLLVMRSVAFFSHGTAGGDASAYELWSSMIADYWRRHGIEWVTADMMPEVAQTALICNTFALINYFNGSTAPLAYTALAALAGCLTALEVFRSGREFGASERGATLAMYLVLFSPALIYHTSDCYKDGFVALFTVMSFTGSMRLAKKFTVPQALLLVLWMLGLWYVRFYMVFMCGVPIIVGLLGLKSRSPIRRLLSIAGTMIFVVVAFYGGIMRSSAVSRMTETYEISTDSNVKSWNAEGGSGVTFNDGGNPFGAIGPKLLYTVASPFPWQGGSVGLHLGKIDVFIFYYLIYRAYLTSRRLFVTDRAVLIQFASFLVPATVAYATTMANIGLILRQRMPIVFVTAILAAMSWSEKKVPQAKNAPARKPSPALARVPVRSATAAVTKSLPASAEGAE